MTYSGIILTTAARYALNPDLLAAQIQVESGGDPWAWNPEPAYHYLWNVKMNAPFRALSLVESASEAPPIDFPQLAGDRDQEWWGQQASWGLMQIMGAVAREHGFKGAYLSELCDPQTNLSIGCMHLAKLFEWAKGNAAQALAAYNGGRGGNSVAPFRNQAYADKVFAMQEKLR